MNPKAPPYWIMHPNATDYSATLKLRYARPLKLPLTGFSKEGRLPIRTPISRREEENSNIVIGHLYIWTPNSWNIEAVPVSLTFSRRTGKVSAFPLLPQKWWRAICCYFSSHQIWEQWPTPYHYGKSLISWNLAQIDQTPTSQKSVHNSLPSRLYLHRFFQL